MAVDDHDDDDGDGDDDDKELEDDNDHCPTSPSASPSSSARQGDASGDLQHTDNVGGKRIHKHEICHSFLMLMTKMMKTMMTLTSGSGRSTSDRGPSSFSSPMISPRQICV